MNVGVVVDSKGSSSRLRKKDNSRSSNRKSKSESSSLRIVIEDDDLKSSNYRIVWQNYGGSTRLDIFNNTRAIQAVKLQCSDNSLYRFTPPISTVYPNKTLRILAHRMKAPIKSDKIVILVIPVAKVERHIELLFSDTFSPVQKVSIVQVVKCKPPDILAYFEPYAPPSIPCLKFNSTKILFDGDSNATSMRHLCITNSFNMSIGVKIRCTDNNIFLFRPVFAVLRKNSSLNIQITKGAHAEKKSDKMVVCTAILKSQTLPEHQLMDLFSKEDVHITEFAVPLVCA